MTLLDYDFKKDSMPLIQFKIRDSFNPSEESTTSLSIMLIPPSTVPAKTRQNGVDLTVECGEGKIQTMYFLDVKVERVKERIRQQFGIPKSTEFLLINYAKKGKLIYSFY
jgi:hypothetical protein